MAGTLRDGRECQGAYEGHDNNPPDCDAGVERWSTNRAADAPWLHSAPAELSGMEKLDPPSAWLVHAIETEIIPRLMLAHREPALRIVPREPLQKGPGPEEVAALAALVLKRDPGESAAYVEDMRSRGVALELIYLDLLAPTARRLGELWESDECAFTDVTVGLWRLQQVMYELSPDFHDENSPRMKSRRALLAPVPGSQHTFGLFMVAEFFRRAGWQVMGKPDVQEPDLLAAASNEWFDVIGLSAGTEVHIEGLTSVILALRQCSVNPQIAVMVGGPIFTLQPELCTQVGADATAPDAPHAVALAERLMAVRDRSADESARHG